MDEAHERHLKIIGLKIPSVLDLGMGWPLSNKLRVEFVPTWFLRYHLAFFPLCDNLAMKDTSSHSPCFTVLSTGSSIHSNFSCNHLVTTQSMNHNYYPLIVLSDRMGLNSKNIFQRDLLIHKTIKVFSFRLHTQMSFC